MTVTGIKEHMEVIGADGVHVGTVDRIEGGRIKLTKKIAGRVRTKAIIIIFQYRWWRKWKATRFGFLPILTWQ